MLTSFSLLQWSYRIQSSWCSQAWNFTLLWWHTSIWKCQPSVCQSRWWQTETLAVFAGSSCSWGKSRCCSNPAFLALFPLFLEQLFPNKPQLLPAVRAGALHTSHGRWTSSLPPRADRHLGQRLLFCRNKLRSTPPYGTILSNPYVPFCSTQRGLMSPRHGASAPLRLRTAALPARVAFLWWLTRSRRLLGTSADLPVSSDPRSLPALCREDERYAAPAAADGGRPGVRIASATGGGPGARGVWAAAAALTSGGSWAITAATRPRLRLRGLWGCSIYVGGRQDGGGGEENVGVPPTGGGAGRREREEPGPVGGSAESGVTEREAGAGGRREGGGEGGGSRGGGWRSRAGCRSLACHPCGAARARARRWSESRRAATWSHLRRAVKCHRRSCRRTSRPATALPARSHPATSAGPNSGSPPGPSRRRCRHRHARAGGRSRRRRGRRSRSARRSAWRWCWRTPPRRAAWSSATRSCCCAGTRGYRTSPSPSSLLLPLARAPPRFLLLLSAVAGPGLASGVIGYPLLLGGGPGTAGGAVSWREVRQPRRRCGLLLALRLRLCPWGEGYASHLFLSWPGAPGLCCGLRRRSVTVLCPVYLGLPPCRSPSLPGEVLHPPFLGALYRQLDKTLDHAWSVFRVVPRLCAAW